MAKKKSTIKLSTDDKILHIVVTVIMVALCILVMYPLIYVLSSSFSSGSAVSSGRVLLWPVEFSIQGYKVVFSYKSVWTGYANTIFYTVVGTVLNLVLTTMAAYPLSRRNFQGRKLYTTIFMITMFFSGGLVPTYIMMTKLGLTNTRWVIILNGALSVYNMIIMRTNFQSIPQELLESAKIDGISDIGYLFKIVMPLSKAVFSVITLYYAVAHWNSYFTALMYTRDKELWPLQMVLRTVMNAAQVDPSEITDAETLAALSGVTDVMKHSMIVISAVPVLIMYPFVQKFFEKGVMIGSVKG